MINHYLKRAVSNRMGLGLVLLVLSFVIGWRLLVIACSHTPPHWSAIAREIGSIAHFESSLYPNESGTRAVFSQDVEKGVGIYFCETDSGKTKLLCEQLEKGYSWQRFGMLGWSPDDKLFAYAVPLKHQLNEGQREEQIVVCNGLSGEAVAKISADPNLYELAWLAPHSFVYSTDFNYDLRLIGQNPDGKWVLRQVFEKVATNKLETLTAISESSVAWQKENEIWTLDFSTSAFKKIWESTTNQLESFTYSRETGEYHLICSDETGWLFVDLDPQGSVLDVTRDRKQERYAYLRDEAGTNVFYIKAKADSQPTRVVWQGAVEDHMDPIGDYISNGKYLYGDCLFFTGDLPGQPVGLWQYNTQNEILRCLASGLKRPLARASIVVPRSGVITNALGKQMSYHIWEPVKVDAGKKYPLIITQTTYGWSPYQQVAAQDGYYFATVARPFWSDKTIYNWGADMMALYAIMIKNPNIDTNRVFLFATSMDTAFLSQLVSERPDLWRGAILINPSAVPNLSFWHNPKIFIVAGRNQAGEVGRLTKYQDAAAKLGIPVKLVLQKDSEHIPRSVATERGRTVQLAKFLSEN
jgi:dipeptidyl aminopeptidase/acylaminoacyl peptidase